MAVKGSFPIKVDSNLHGLARVLKSAACEWLLLFLLLLDGAFSYFLTKFAQYCELQLPCILCSRLDHVLGKEKPDFYVNLLCNNHKSEISSLVSCHNHGKLVDVHGMCEECLLSFANNDPKEEETYKIFVGKLGSDCIQKPLVNLDFSSGSLTTKFCSCCSKPWRSRPSVQKLVQSKLPSTPVSSPEISPPKSPRHRCLNSQQGLKNRRDRFPLPTKPLVLGSKDHDSLFHVGYTEVKISSDSDSDIPFSDDDDLTCVPRNWKSNESLSRQGSKFTPKSQYVDVFPAMQRQKSTPATSNLMLSQLDPEKGETTTPRFVSNGDLRAGLGELNWQQLMKKASLVAPELISLDDIPLSSSAPKGSPAISAAEGDRASLSNTLDASGYSDFISHKTALSSENMQLPARLSKENCKEIGDMGLTSATNNWESIDLNSTSTLSSRKDAAFAPNNNSAIGARDLAPITIKDVKASSLLSDGIGRRACNGIESVIESSVSKVSNPQTDLLSSSLYPPEQIGRSNCNGIEFPEEPSVLKVSNPQTDSLSSNIYPPEQIGRSTCNGIESAEESSVSKVSDPQTDLLSSNLYPPEQIGRSICNGIESAVEQSVSKVSDPQTESLSSNIYPFEQIHRSTSNDIESAEERSVSKVSDPQTDSLSSNMYPSEQICRSTSNDIESAKEPSVSKLSEPPTDSLSSYKYPPMNGLSDEPQKIHNSSSNDTLMPPKAPGMERSQSYESLEENVSEIEGESLVDKLRRQVEYDKNCINNLHRELDEERNASAIAANQAMAMITKLQEEKAALNMEALQYLRMMEEQAEYDVEALEKANEMIAERDKEIQELEAELDYFRIKYPEDFPEMN